jgi:iron-sulfur cluster repair protein YtfE (RIC family)
MPVQIGAKTHSFSDPTALLSDCHRRIEMFLGSLQQVAPMIDQPLEANARLALEGSLRYFREAAPKHTADEEESLFPRMRRVENADVKAALATLDALETEHRRADSLHAEVDALGSEALQHGPLSPDEAERFRDAVAELASIYKDHIRIEDDIIFPVAGRTLPATEKSAIALEMAARRNVARPQH